MTNTETQNTKILFIITKGNFGGAQRYVYDLSTNLPKEKFDVVVACGDQDGDSLKNKLESANIKTITLRGSGREIETKNDFSVLKQIISIIESEKPNVIHLNSSKIGFLGVVAVTYLRLKSLIFNLKFSIPLCVFTSHGWAFNEKNRSALWKNIYIISYFITIIFSDKVTAVSHKTKKDISWLPFIKNKIKVIHNGISQFETINRDEARQILECDKEILICSIGELHPSKGYDVALKAISKIPKDIKDKICYRIIGDGEEKEKIQSRISELELTNTVKLLGQIDNAKKILSGVDILLFPSRNENLPYVILEAGQSKKAIVATGVGGIGEIITDMEEGILVHKENVKELLEGIIYMISHTEKQKEFGENIFNKIQKEFSIDKMVSETIKIYLGR